MSEYSIENLIFKEIRNLGYLDNLKELRDKVISARLSLEEKLENPRQREAIRVKIQQLTHYPPIIQMNGIFEIHNIPEADARHIIALLRAQDFVAYAQVSANGYDFSKPAIGKLPSRKCTIYGKLID